MDVFKRQAEWSSYIGLPLVIHSRNAQKEILEVLSPMKCGLHGGIFHCFGGNAEEARQLLDFDGFCLGIGGVVTFKKSKLGETLREYVPLSRIVLETDAPYLAPTPHRGKRNEPSFIPLVIKKLAEIYGVSEETVAKKTTENALGIFKKIGAGFEHSK